MPLFKPIPEEKKREIQQKREDSRAKREDRKEAYQEKREDRQQAFREKVETRKQDHSASREAKAERAQGKPLKVSLGNAKYLGGLPEDPKPHKLITTLIGDEGGIGCGTLSARKLIVQWDECVGVTIDGGQVAKRKTGAIVAFGVLGGLGGKGAADRAFLTVHRKDGAVACYQIEKKSPQAVRAQITALLNKVGVRFLDGPETPSTNTA